MRYKEVGGNRKSEKEYQNVPRVMLTLISLAVFLLAPVLCAEERTSSNIFGQCILPLGMEEGKIPDDAITASSSYETKSVGPQNARIRQEKNGGAWCPKAQISSQIREYLEVDLTRNHLITWTETQGRFGNGQGQEYAEAFFLEYWRDSRWHQYKNLKGDRILRGNSNTYLVEKQKLDLPFVASRVRFVPYSQHPRTVCMRVEIYGCIWEQPVARYTAPVGSFSGPNGCNVEDTSYDGMELEGQMIKGLGQLIDGILGEDTEISSCSGGTNWVGWTDRETVRLIFEFQDLREFENCSIHVASLPERGIQVFSSVRIWTSVDGINYQSEPEKLELSGNLETGMVSVGLQSRLGKYVKLEMKLALTGSWLLISEVAFETVSGTKNLSGGDTSEGVHRNDTDSRMDLPEKPLSAFNETIYDEPVDPGTGTGVNGNSTPDAFPVGSSQTYIGLVSGLLTMVALLLTCTTFLMKQRGRNKVALLQKHTALLCGSPAPSITINTKDVKLPNPVVMNGLAQSRLSLKCKPPVADRETNSRAASISASSAPGRDYELYSAYERSYDSFSTENLSRQPSTASCDPDYSDVKGKPSFGNEKLPENTPFPPKRPNLFHSGKFNQRVHEGYYAATDILTIKKREQSPTLSLFTPLHIHDKDARLPRNIEPYDVQRISRHRLRILDKLGEGSFGLVHMCEAKGIQNPEIGSVQNRQVVIVRSLWRGVVDSLRKDFTKDMYILSRIRDANVARMLALVEEEPLGAVFEYGQLGDLPAFFEKQEDTGDDTPASYAYCLNFATQIASGMKYLESLNLPHCDLAARNCIVCQNLTIKVSDHAMYCGKYDNQYYVDGSYAKVPLRWMAWEAALLSKKSCQADVWSYAVTVWEILTSCKEIPYSDFTAEQVMENLNRWYQAGLANENSHPRILSRPSCCLDDLYRMMTKCWTKQPDDRPTFEEIYLYLKRLGFD